MWLVDLERDRTVWLDGDARGRLAVPQGVRTADHPEVDVSVEPDPSHSGANLLRGSVLS